MIIPFFTEDIEVIEEKNTGTITIKGDFGLGFKGYLRNLLGNDDRMRALFREISLTSLKFDEFFLPEVLAVFNHILKERRVYRLNLKTADKIINYFKKEQDDDKATLDYNQIKKVMAFNILEHQDPIFKRYEVFRKELRLKGMLLDADPGTGKTFSSLALCESLHADKVIIICPLATLDEVWVDSLTGPEGVNVYKEKQDIYCLRDRNKVKYNNQKFIIAHYESLTELNAMAKSIKFKNLAIIIDESHNLACSDSKRTKEAIDLINTLDPNNVFPLSGTPLKSSFKELGVLFKFLDPHFTDIVERRFYTLYKNCNKWLGDLLTARYTGISVKVTKDSLKLEEPITNYISIKIPNGQEYTLNTIRKKLREFVERRTSEINSKKALYRQRYEVLRDKALELGSKEFTSREILNYKENFERLVLATPGELMMGRMSEIMKSVNDFESRLARYLTGLDKKDFNECKTIVKYPELKVQGEALGLVITKARIDCHADIARTLDYKSMLDSTLKKSIIFSSYIGICNAAMEKLKKEKYRPVGVYGDTVKNLPSIVAEWSKNPKINPIVATYKSLSTGVRLTAGNVVVCLDLPFRMYTYNQAISRVWRLGQDSTVNIYIVTLDTDGEPNINSRNVDIITFFKEEIEKITGYKAGIDLDINLSVSQEDYDFYCRNDLYLNIPKNVKPSFESLINW